MRHAPNLGHVRPRDPVKHQSAAMENSPRITLNETGTLVTFEYCGHVTAEGIASHCAEVGALAARLKPGFTALADLTGLDHMDPGCAPVISKVMEQLSSMGIARVVRVMPDPKKDIGLGILSLFHYRSGVEINTVQTLEDGMNLVAKA